MMLLVLILSVFCAVTYGCPDIISRRTWFANNPTCREKLQTPVSYVFIHHTAGPGCSSDYRCRTLVKAIQLMHMEQNKWCDIGYNFLVGGDGTIYEGRGWNTLGAHTLNYNSKSIGISFIGTFTNDNPSTAAQNAALKLIAYGVNNNFIRPNYILKGHRDVSNTECPGNTFYKTITKWPHFKAGEN